MLTNNISFFELSKQFTEAVKQPFENTPEGVAPFSKDQLSPQLKSNFETFAFNMALTDTDACLLLLCANSDLTGKGIRTEPAENHPYTTTPYTIFDLQFLLGANNELVQQQILLAFMTGSRLLRDGFVQLYLPPVTPGLFVQSYVMLTGRGLERCIAMNNYIPAFGPEFPARKIAARQDWSNLVLSNVTMQSINDVLVWLQHRSDVIDDTILSKSVKQGYRALFYGQPGTGKTLTATLLGKKANLPVYCIDLSMVVSKYIGETEKNLENVFRALENEDCILFFDEADALFGKRTNVSTSNDRYANQEVSYLLQRLEDFKGLTILASNYRSNIDQAFTRRFNAIIHFAMPGKEERVKMWQLSEPGSLKFTNDVNINLLADKFELSGATIVNSVHYAFLRSRAAGKQHIELTDLLEGIRKEYSKMEKNMPVWLQSEKS